MIDGMDWVLVGRIDIDELGFTELVLRLFNQVVLMRLVMALFVNRLRKSEAFPDSTRSRLLAC